jgi:hypothetical protein
LTHPRSRCTLPSDCLERVSPHCATMSLNENLPTYDSEEPLISASPIFVVGRQW